MNILRTETASHYLRVARALALVGATAGCGVAVQPAPDGTTPGPDVAVVDAGGDVVPGDPCASPGPYGAPCAQPVTCGMGCGAWVCRTDPTTTNLTWIQQLCGGPLPPPELPC